MGRTLQDTSWPADSDRAQSGQVSVSPAHLSLLARPTKPDWDLSPTSHLCLLPKGPVFQEDDSNFPSDSTEKLLRRSFSDTAQEPAPGLSGLRVQAKPAPRHTVGPLGIGPCFSVPDSLYLRILPGFEITETLETVWQKGSLFQWPFFNHGPIS